MKQFYVGIDLGGTSVRLVTYDKESNRISDVKKKPLSRMENAVKMVEENIVKLIDLACQEKHIEGKEIGGIGIAMAALFDRKTGIITSWPNNDRWNNFPIKQYLEERYHVPVVLEDDANAAALGEQLAGAGRGYTDLVYVTVSTGIGCGIIINNSLITGFNGWAGELGHIKVSGKDVVCTCGAKGCLQAFASGPAILKAYFQNVYAAGNREMELKDVAMLAQEGDEQAKVVFEEAGKYIGDALANLIMILDVPIIILGGGVMETGELIFKPIIEQVDSSLQKKRKVKIVRSVLNDKNGVIGALGFIDKFINRTPAITV